MLLSGSLVFLGVGEASLYLVSKFYCKHITLLPEVVGRRYPYGLSILYSVHLQILSDMHGKEQPEGKTETPVTHSTLPAPATLASALPA